MDPAFTVWLIPYSSGCGQLQEGLVKFRVANPALFTKKNADARNPKLLLCVPASGTLVRVASRVGVS
jgi:hypothetical protein